MTSLTRSRSMAAVAAVSAMLVGMGAVAYAAAPGAYDRPGRTERVSVSSSGAQANDFSGFEGDMTGDGRYVVFASRASNLVPGDTNAIDDVFRRDRATGKTVRVSLASDGSQALPGAGCLVCAAGPVISDDGRYVAFTSVSMNLVPGDTNLAADVFVRDMRLKKTIRISVSSKGVQGDRGSWRPSISSDGRYVAFESDATNLVSGDTNGGADIFVHNRKTGSTERVSVASDGSQAKGILGVNSQWAAMSGNARVVVFRSNATNLAPGPTANELCGGCGASDVYAHDRKTGKTIRVTVASDGSPASFAAFPVCRLTCGHSHVPVHAVSDDGRYVTFSSSATNLVPNDTNFSPAHGSGWDVFVRDLVAGRTERVSVDSFGHDKLDPSGGGTIASGRYVGYETRRYHCDGPLSLLPKTAVDNDGLCNLVNGYINGGILTLDTASFVYDRVSGTMDWVSRSPADRDPKAGACTREDEMIGRAPNETRSIALSSDGRYDLMLSSARDLVPGDTNNRCDFFVRDRGKPLGVGGFSHVGSGSGAGKDEVCVADGVCLPQLSTVDSAREVRVEGADLLGARVVPRPGLGDLFVRLDLARMTAVGGSPSGGLLYGVTFTAGGERYEVRVQRAPGVDYDAKGGASFGLFRQDRATGLFTKVASLKGGYGTAGASVVVAVPANPLGTNARLSDVRAFTALGSYDVGVTRLLDSIRLSR